MSACKVVSDMKQILFYLFSVTCLTVFFIFLLSDFGENKAIVSGLLSPVTKKTDNANQNKIIKAGIPVSLNIPRLGIRANIESVGLDKKGNMDVPKNVFDVAWYNLGYRPGETGNAVIAGHLDTKTGAPAVFYNISRLIPGDTLEITDNRNIKYIYKVRSLVSYPYNQFPVKTVFGSSNKRMLNLITCAGTWNSAEVSYTNRLVVFSESI